MEAVLHGLAAAAALAFIAFGLAGGAGGARQHGALYWPAGFVGAGCIAAALVGIFLGLPLAALWLAGKLAAALLAFLP